MPRLSSEEPEDDEDLENGIKSESPGSSNGSSSSDESVPNARPDVVGAEPAPPVLEPVFRQASFTASRPSTRSGSVSTHPETGQTGAAGPQGSGPPRQRQGRGGGSGESGGPVRIVTMDEIKRTAMQCEKLSDRAVQLLGEAPQRELVLRANWKADVNLTRMSNMESALVSLTGDLALQPCRRCAKGSGPFVGCFISRTTGKAWCGNCAWHNYSLRCSFMSEQERASLRRKIKADRVYGPDGRTVKRPRLDLDQGGQAGMGYGGSPAYQASSTFATSSAPPGSALIHPAFAQQQQQQQQPPPPTPLPQGYGVPPSVLFPAQYSNNNNSHNTVRPTTSSTNISADSITIPLPAGTTAQDKRRLAKIFDSLAAALENAADEEEDGLGIL